MQCHAQSSIAPESQMQIVPKERCRPSKAVHMMMRITLIRPLWCNMQPYWSAQSTQSAWTTQACLQLVTRLISTIGVCLQMPNNIWLLASWWGSWWQLSCSPKSFKLISFCLIMYRFAIHLYNQIYVNHLAASSLSPYKAWQVLCLHLMRDHLECFSDMIVRCFLYWLWSAAVYSECNWSISFGHPCWKWSQLDHSKHCKQVRSIHNLDDNISTSCLPISQFLYRYVLSIDL